MSRTAIVVIILVFVIGGITLLLRRSSPVQEIFTHAEKISLSGYQENGNLSWSLLADSGTLDDGGSMLETATLTFTRESDSPIVVYGDRLSRDSSGSTLTGSVQVDQADGLSLRTETLFWDEHNDVLESGPVSIEMATATIDAGAFHHNLDTGITTLMHGIEAQITHESVAYTAHSDSAEANEDQLALIGNVSIETETEDTYTCQRLESDPSTSSIHLIGDVIGSWQGNEFAAGTVLLNESGIRLHEDVTTNLNLLMMEESHDT